MSVSSQVQSVYMYGDYLLGFASFFVDSDFCSIFLLSFIFTVE